MWLQERKDREWVAVAPVGQTAAARYLARDPAGNVEPLVSLLHDEDVGAWGARRGELLVGVLVVGRQWRHGPRTATIEANDADAFAALYATIPPDVTQFTVHRAETLPLLEAAFALAPVPQDALCYLVARSVAVPPSPLVRPLTEADAALIAASATPWGDEGFTDALENGYRVFGVEQGGRLVARAMAAYNTGFTEEVAAVWTAHRWRGRGLATAVVATVAADILARVPLATYAVRPDNLASLRVAAKAGFTLAHHTATFALPQERTRR